MLGNIGILKRMVFQRPRLFFLGKEGTGESAFRQCSGQQIISLLLAGSQLDLYLSKLPRARV